MRQSQVRHSARAHRLRKTLQLISVKKINWSISICRSISIERSIWWRMLNAWLFFNWQNINWLKSWHHIWKREIEIKTTVQAPYQLYSNQIANSSIIFIVKRIQKTVLYLSRINFTLKYDIAHDGWWRIVWNNENATILIGTFIFNSHICTYSFLFWRFLRSELGFRSIHLPMLPPLLSMMMMYYFFFRLWIWPNCHGT